MASSTPWTPSELRKNARSWTLEGDAKLLEYMQSISENLEKRAQNSNSKMDQLVMNLEETNVSLDNVTNKLSALQHSQFVENRVYEDDETIANESEVPVDIQNEKESYDPIETLNKVLKNSIAMMDKCYEKISLDVEDSDDEEGLTKSIVYKPKNFFEDRRLPYIIGSKEWKEKWHIGICDTDEEYSDEENKEEYSDTSENVSLSASLPSNAPTLSESESSVWGLHPHMNAKRPPVYSPSSDEDMSSNTVTSKTSSEDIHRLNNNRHVVQPAQIVSPPEPKYYVHKPKEKGLFDESSEESEEDVKKQSPKAQVQPVKKLPVNKPMVNGISNIISDEPPELDEVDKRENSVSNQLFYDSEDEKPKKEELQSIERPKQETSNIRKKPVNLFDDDDFDSFMKELDKKTSEKVNQISKSKVITNLFDDGLEDQEAELPEVATPDPAKQVKADTAQVVPERKLYNTTLFDDEPEEDNIFANIANKPKSVAELTTKIQVRNLFDDDSSDDEFDRIFKSKLESSNKPNKASESDFAKKANAAEISSTNNFEKVIRNTESAQNKSPKQIPIAPTLFSDEPPEDNLFEDSILYSRGSEIKQSAKGDVDKINNDTTTINAKVQELFSADDEDDIFGSLSKPPVPTPRVTTDASNKVPAVFNTDVNVTQAESIIPPFDDEVEQLSSSDMSKSETVSQISIVPITESKDKTIDLFEDDNNKSNAGVNIKESKQSTLSGIFFDDEPPDDDIFNIVNKGSSLGKVAPIGAKENVEQTNNKGKSKDIEEVKNATESKPISSKFKLPTLFDDEPPEDDNDLFGYPSKNVIKSTKGDEIIVEEKKNLQNTTEDKLENKKGDENIGTDYLSTTTEKEYNSKKSQRVSVPQFNEESLAEDMPQEENNSNKTMVGEDTSAHKENDTKTAFVNEFNVVQQEHDSNTSSLGEIDNCTKDKDKQPSASLYNSINLFQDIPPDDDFPSSSDTKRLHNIFYDDFAETIPSASNYSRKQPSNYFFSEEPPPDSFDDDTISETEKELPKVEEPPTPALPLSTDIKVADKVPKNQDQSEIDNKILSVADLIKKAGSESEFKKLKPSIPPPKKLNTNLNINVAALMPGAKRPNLKSEDIIKKQSSTEEEESSSSSSLFSNSLRQSSTVVKVVTPVQSSDPNILPNLTKSRPKMQGKRPSTRRGRQEKYRKSLVLDATDAVSNQNSSIRKPGEGKFDNSFEEFNPKPSIIGEHDIGEKLSTKEIPSKSSDVQRSNEEKVSTSQQSDLLDNDCLIKSVQSEITSLPTFSTEKEHTKTNKIFDDVDDDDNLFASVGKVTTHESVKPTTPDTAQTKETPAEMKPPQSKNRKSVKPAKAEANTTKSLFTDDESDDDLFASTQKSKPRSVKPLVVNAKDKLFSSDDDDEDLFGKVLKDSKNDNKSEKKVLINLPVPSSKSLFGDDDEDDIFGVVTAKSKVTTTRIVAAPKKPEKRSPVGSITEDNPLADLLND